MSDREVDRSARQWADAQTAQVVAAAKEPFPATVTAITPSVQVSWRGATITATRVAPAYTPGIGDRVICTIVSDQLVILG